MRSGKAGRKMFHDCFGWSLGSETGAATQRKMILWNIKLKFLLSIKYIVRALCLIYKLMWK